MKAYLEESGRVLEAVGSAAGGLRGEEAARRLAENGKNRLSEPKRDSGLKRFLSALNDPMILLLLGAAGVSTATTVYQNRVQGANENYADLFIILFVVIINTILSVVQEFRAEAAIDALKEMTAATSHVLRDGVVITVKSEDLVVGDVILLEAGDAVPADCRVLESHSMKVEEAALTGESIPVTKMRDLLLLQNKKDIPLGDRVNMVYSGSTVVYGRGSAVVVAAGMETEIGRIADALSQAADDETPLAKSLEKLSLTLTKAVMGVCTFVFLFGVARELLLARSDAGIFTAVLNTFIIAVALAVAAIPEGLPAVTTIIMSIGVTSMSRRNAFIRKLTAVETLGCTQVICSDKTGTLTQNKMTVVDTFTKAPTLLATAMALCNDASRTGELCSAEGEPTECALVNYAWEQQLFKDALEAKMPRVGEAPFDSGRKMMSTVHRDGTGYIQYTKGACEILLTHCTAYLDDAGIRPMTDAFRAETMVQVKRFADRALRVLGAAYRTYDRPVTCFDAAALENGLTFIGFVGMMDPCRPEAYGAVQECREAGIRPVMITGDHIDTAVAIARDLGILSDASQALEGAAISGMTDRQLMDAVPNYSVYARVQPEHKTRIVRAWKARGMVTAMTGDGVNDAPSIKAADIGVGMGITGTTVTKSVSDIVLADDNFATIVSAVEEGRKIYDNIRKVVQFQLTTNLAEIVAVFTASMLGFRLLSAAHLLWINLVTDSAPGLALGMEAAEPGIMKRKPRPSDESLFANGAGTVMIVQGVFMGLLILFSYFFGERIENGAWRFAQSHDGMTMAFLTCSFVEMFRAFCCRSLTRSAFAMKTRNKWLWLSLLWTAALTCGVIFVPPLAGLFGFTGIHGGELLIALGLAATIVPVSELAKLVQRRRLRR